MVQQKATLPVTNSKFMEKQVSVVRSLILKWKYIVHDLVSHVGHIACDIIVEGPGHFIPKPNRSRNTQDPC